jgi:hypothetical protein
MVIMVAWCAFLAMATFTFLSSYQENVDQQFATAPVSFHWILGVGRILNIILTLLFLAKSNRVGGVHVAVAIAIGLYWAIGCGLVVLFILSEVSILVRKR